MMANADFAKCANKKCPLNKVCYRFVAPSAGETQTWSDFVPNADGTCDSFAEIKFEESNERH